MIKEWAYYGPGAEEGVAWRKKVGDEVGGWDTFGSFEDFLEGMEFN